MRIDVCIGWRDHWGSTHSCYPRVCVCVSACVCVLEGGGGVLRRMALVLSLVYAWMTMFRPEGSAREREREWGHILPLLGGSPCRAADTPKAQAGGQEYVCMPPPPPSPGSKAPSANPLLSHPGWGPRRSSWGCCRGGRT